MKHSQHYYHLNRRPVMPQDAPKWLTLDCLLVTLVLGILLGVSALVASMRLVDWWQARAEPVQQILGETVMPPVNSEFNNALVDWVVRHGAVNRNFAQLIVTKTFEASLRRHVDPLLMLALISVESRFDPLAVSSAGALGLTQIIPKWHTEKVNMVHVFDPEVNISVGAEILREYTLRHKGDTTKALLQYNGSLETPGAYAVKVKWARTQLVASVMTRVLLE